MPKFDVTNDGLEALLLKVDGTSDFEILLCDMNDAHVLFHAQSLRTYIFGHEMVTLYTTFAVTANRFEACKDAPSSALCVLDKAAFAIILDKSNWRQMFHDYYNEGDFARSIARLLELCIMWKDGRPILETVNA